MLTNSPSDLQDLLRKMKTPSKRLDCKELQARIVLIIKDDHQPASELLTVKPNKLLCVHLPVGSIKPRTPSDQNQNKQQVCPVTQIKLWRIRVPGRRGGGWEYN